MTIQKTILDPSFYDYSLLSKKQLVTIFEFHIDYNKQRLKDNTKKSRKQNKRVKKSSVNNHQSDMRCYFIYFKNSKEMEPDIYDLPIDITIKE